MFTIFQRKFSDPEFSPLPIKREASQSSIEVLDQDSEARIPGRKSYEAYKRELTIAALKASIRHHESAVEANEAKAAWYRAQLQSEGFELPSPNPLSHESQLPWAE